jgi:hypothetical protein
MRKLQTETSISAMSHVWSGDVPYASPAQGFGETDELVGDLFDTGGDSFVGDIFAVKDVAGGEDEERDDDADAAKIQHQLFAWPASR